MSAVDQVRTAVSRRSFLRTATLAAGGAALGQGCGDSGSKGGDSFTVVALPDTQNYAKDHPEIFMDQTRWIADNRDSLQIAFVTHLGDIVNNGPSQRPPPGDRGFH